MATNIGHACQRAGHKVTAVYSQTMPSAEMLATALGATATTDVSRLPMKADVFLVSVKDAVLRPVAAAAAEGRQGQMFLHTAGSMPMTVLEGLTTRYGVLYPLQTFSKERLLDFTDIPLFVEANSEDSQRVVTQLAGSLSRHVYECSSDKRKQLHLAAVFACNFANHCYALSAEVLARHGLPFDILLPLIDETAHKVHELHPLDAQTGPAVRYDENVIGMQLNMLASSPDLRDIYERLSQSIHQKAKEYGQLRLKEDSSYRV